MNRPHPIQRWKTRRANKPSLVMSQLVGRDIIIEGEILVDWPAVGKEIIISIRTRDRK